MKYLLNVVTLKLDARTCTGCGRCVEVCPRGVFSIEGTKAVIRDRDLCIECGACEKNCAFGAVEVCSGVGCAAAVINGMLSGGEPSCDCSQTGKGKSGCC